MGIQKLDADRWLLASGLEPTTWQEAEPYVLAAMSEQGWFGQGADGAEQAHALVTEVVAQLVERRTGRRMRQHARCGSTLFDEVDVDLLYAPGDDDTALGASVRVFDCCAGEAESTQLVARRLRTYVREVACEALDFKQRYAPPLRIWSVANWIKESRPRFYAVWVVRVASVEQFHEVRATMHALGSWCNAVGAMFFRADPNEPTRSVALQAPELGIDRVIRHMAAVVHSAHRDEGLGETASPVP